MSKNVYSRERHIKKQYEKLQNDISRWKDNANFEKQFTEQLYHVECLILNKLKKLTETTKKLAKQVVDLTTERTNKLKERLEYYI